MIRNRVPGAALVLLAVFGSAPAYAQVEQRGSTTERARTSNVAVTSESGPDYTATFDDDLLTSLVSTGDIPSIKVRGVRTFGRLTRPRTHFVSELLKSVEHI